MINATPAPTNQTGFIAAIGEVLAEILADTPGNGFLQAQPLYGPLPSGAPAIFIDQVGKLGFACGMIGSVGEDDFGRLNVERLRRDGVDVSALAMRPGRATGTAFVRYRPDGNRDFVFNIADSASGQFAVEAAGKALLTRASHLHVMGSTAFSAEAETALRDAVALMKAKGATVSFDPNIRKELLRDGKRRAFLDWVLARTDIFMPSGEEIFMFAPGADGDVDAAAGALLARGLSAVVVKNGARGATAYTQKERVALPAFAVAEIDPTGAGDCFGGTFVACHLMGKPLAASLRYANAAGALQVTRRGPMEGTSSFAQLDAFLAGKPS